MSTYAQGPYAPGATPRQPYPPGGPPAPPYGSVFAAAPPPPPPYGSPFGAPPPPPGPAPRYRERRPVRWWMVLAGVGGSVVWYLLITLLTWSVSSFVLLMLLGMLVAGGATGVLVWRGDRGLAVGVGSMVGVALSYTVVGAAGAVVAESIRGLG